MQYAVLLGACALAAVAARRFVLGGAALALALVNAALFVPVWFGGPERSAPLDVSILFANVNSGNDRYSAFATEIRERRPDVVAIAELTPAWLDALRGSLGPYANRRVALSGEGSYGLGLFSRLPLEDVSVRHPAGGRYPVVVATVRGRVRPIRLVLVHPPPPIWPRRAGPHRRILADAAGLARSAEIPVAVLGDLNATPWSADFRRLVSDGGLGDTRKGFGLEASWPTWLWPLRIPIDHVLVSTGLETLDRELAAPIGSDHRPVWVELGTR